MAAPFYFNMNHLNQVATFLTQPSAASNINLRDVISLADTTRGLSTLPALYLQTLVSTYLSSYGDPQTILQIMAAQSIIIAGPPVTALLQGYDPQRVRCPLLFFCIEYKGNLLVRYFQENKFDVDHTDTIDSLAPKFLPNHAFPIINHVTRLTRFNEGSTQLVHIYDTKMTAAPDVVRAFTATFYMSFLYDRGLVMLYPDATFRNIGLVHGDWDDHDKRLYNKGELLHGFTVSKDAGTFQACRTLCPRLQRQSWDDHTLCLNFPHHEFADSPFVEDWTLWGNSCVCGQCDAEYTARERNYYLYLQALQRMDSRRSIQ
ncbi:hypothetical protein SISSUDRAFT_1118811 [Sistotremastrum suecicum HHB10207 ss-3]|uniref:Uncharacterized protein n=1 Tax=Sistotremastrum suecicum HHB10207 ss-3 TaxID=1314776 RepID=A0A166EHF0_9AGAM|nr:hypothetical protein SISSUDRAFT_1118811 [Sistotremastrum suecicum HHB10207 ss-3]